MTFWELWKNFKGSEKGAILGLLVGGYILLMSYLFKIGFDSTFCLEISEPAICIRYISLMPLIFGIIGILSGIIIDYIQKQPE